MRILPAILPAALSLLIYASPMAHAHEPDAPAPQGRTALKPAPKPAPKPDAEAVKKKPPPRRAVHQIIDGMQPSTGAPSYGPRLTPRPPPLVPPQPMPMPSPSAPAQINSCDGGGCTDTNGARYNGGVGNTVISPQGRLCTTTGTTVQCL